MLYLEKCVVTYFEVLSIGVNCVSHSGVYTLALLSAIYCFTITAQILARSLANFYRQ